MLRLPLEVETSTPTSTTLVSRNSFSSWVEAGPQAHTHRITVSLYNEKRKKQRQKQKQPKGARKLSSDEPLGAWTLPPSQAPPQSPRSSPFPYPQLEVPPAAYSCPPAVPKPGKGHRLAQGLRNGFTRLGRTIKSNPIPWFVSKLRRRRAGSPDDDDGETRHAHAPKRVKPRRDRFLGASWFCLGPVLRGDAAERTLELRGNPLTSDCDLAARNVEERAPGLLPVYALPSPALAPLPAPPVLARAPERPIMRTSRYPALDPTPPAPSYPALSAPAPSLSPAYPALDASAPPSPAPGYPAVDGPVAPAPAYSALDKPGHSSAPLARPGSEGTHAVYPSHAAQPQTALGKARSLPPPHRQSDPTAGHQSLGARSLTPPASPPRKATKDVFGYKICSARATVRLAYASMDTCVRRFWTAVCAASLDPHVAPHYPTLSLHAPEAPMCYADFCAVLDAVGAPLSTSERRMLFLAAQQGRAPPPPTPEDEACAPGGTADTATLVGMLTAHPQCRPLPKCVRLCPATGRSLGHLGLTEPDLLSYLAQTLRPGSPASWEWVDVTAGSPDAAAPPSPDEPLSPAGSPDEDEEDEDDMDDMDLFGVLGDLAPLSPDHRDGNGEAEDEADDGEGDEAVPPVPFLTSIDLPAKHTPMLAPPLAPVPLLGARGCRVTLPDPPAPCLDSVARDTSTHTPSPPATATATHARSPVFADSSFAPPGAATTRAEVVRAAQQLGNRQVITPRDFAHVFLAQNSSVVQQGSDPAATSFGAPGHSPLRPLALTIRGAKPLAGLLGTNRLKAVDRRTGLLVTEFVQPVLRQAMRALYRTRWGRLSIHTNTVKRWLAAWTERRGQSMGLPQSTKQIIPFARQFRIDLSEVELPVGAYKTFNEFFARRLRPGMRPIASPEDPSVIVSPADCRVSVFYNLTDAARLWIKGASFSLPALLDHRPALVALFETQGAPAANPATCFVSSPRHTRMTRKARKAARREVVASAARKEQSKYACSLVVARLAPQDYHRVHLPVDAHVLTTYQVPGTYYTVNPIAVRTPGIDVFTQNRRLLFHMRSPTHGDFVVVFVGATLVGSCIPVVSPGAFCPKGSELGYFAFGGSTVLLLFRSGSVRFDPDLLRTTRAELETIVRMGERIGRGVGTPRGLLQASALPPSPHWAPQAQPSSSALAGQKAEPDCTG